MTDLPERLRIATRELHAQAERAGVMAELLEGRLAVPGYCALLRNLHAIYAALETALDSLRTDPAVALLGTDALRRAPALARDLAALHGPRWADELPVLAAAADYARRLQALGATGSRTLVAHAYVRYLGDLHGGQVLKRLLLQMPGIAAAQAGAGAGAGAGSGSGSGSGSGVHFYDFGLTSEVIALRQALRAALAQLPVSPAEAEAIVAEARWAFTQHRRLFEALSSG